MQRWRPRARTAVPVLLAAVAAAGLAIARGGDGATSAADEPVATTADATTATVPSDPDLGDVLRLPRPSPGDFTGRLVWNRADCTTDGVDLATGDPVAGPDRACDLWPSPAGGALAFSTEGTAGGERFGPLAILTADGRELSGPVRGGIVATADDGAVATCASGTVTERRPDGRRRALPGCGPAYAGAALLRITRDERRVVDDAGRTVVPAGRGTIRVLAATGRDVAVLRARGAGGGTIEVWRDGRRTGATTMGGSGQPGELRLARGGATVLVRLRGPQEWAAFRTRRPGSLAVIGREGVRGGAFSPDGRRIALVLESAIVIADAARLAPLAAIPADAEAVAWLR